MHKSSFNWEYEWIRPIQVLPAAPPHAAQYIRFRSEKQIIKLNHTFNFNNFHSQNDTWWSVRKNQIKKGCSSLFQMLVACLMQDMGEKDKLFLS
jgi:hypothetical protein